MSTIEPQPRGRLRLDPVEAVRTMRQAGLEPLVPYPGAHKPWPSLHLRCGREIAPLLSNVRRRGTACQQCAAWARGMARRARHAEEAVRTMVESGFEPLVDYPGAGKPWRSRHTPCGREASPSLNSVRRTGLGCAKCSLAARGWRTWSDEEAVAYFDLVGLEPLELYPGSSTTPWRSRHRTCGRIVSPRLGNIAQGQGPCRECGLEATHRALRLDDTVARRLMQEAGLDPISPFPGADKPWRCRHLKCGTEVSPSYSNVKRGQGGCVQCAARAAALRLRMPENVAVAVFVGAGLQPLEEYPGSMRPWGATHTCGGVVSPTLSNVRAGRGICRYCNSSFPFAGEADIYMVANGTAIKIGIAAPESNRLSAHRRQGWHHVWSIRLATGDDAYNLEQAVLRWWRDDLGLPPAYPTSAMPQQGATETVTADDVSPSEVLIFVLQRLEEQGVSDPLVMMATSMLE